MKKFRWLGVKTGIFLMLMIIVIAASYMSITGVDGVKEYVLPNTMVGALSFLFVFGVFFGEIGNKIPFWNKYIGGGAILVFIVAALFSTYNLIPVQIQATVINFYDNWDFLALFISILITGSILGIERKLLVRSLGGYLPAIFGGLIVAALFGITFGFFFGISPAKALLNYVLPIMGGGTGAGAIPMSQMYAQATGDSAENWFAFAISILTIANIFSIITGSLLNALGKKRPSLTGEGELVRVKKSVVAESKEVKVEFKITKKEYASALMFATTMYVFAELYSSKLSIVNNFVDIGFKIHTYAFLVIFVAILNLCNLVPLEVKEGTKALSKFFSGHFLWVLMAAVGMTTDVNEIINAITLTNLIIALVVVVGAVIGSGFVGKLVGFYPIETAITAGLCMANRGGSGDIAVLAAADRMNLISYAQISSRVGGALVLIVASIMFGIFM